MMPALGAYAGAVLGAYAVTLALLGLLVLVSVLRGSQARRALARLEGETRTRPAGRPDREPGISRRGRDAGA